jgi:5-methylcytosine-specific restriction enzyme subunit McrC
MTRRVLELREEEAGRFPGAALRDSEVLALKSSGKFEVEPASVFNEYKHSIRSQGWVGQIPVGDDLLVRVAPKVSVRNLFRMLEVVYNLSSFRLFEGDIEIEVVEDIYDLIVSILARRVIDRARKGLYRHFIGESGDLPYVRGSIDAVGTVLNGVRGIPQIACKYEEHTADVEENRILYWTLTQVRRQIIRRDKVRSELDRARRALAQVQSERVASTRRH